MNELKKMFEQNLVFQRKVIKNFDKLSLKEKQALTKDYILHCISELTEVLASINWKTWSDTNKKLSLVQLKEELIDAQKFLLNISLIWGMKHEEYFSKFERKTEVNLQRFVQKELLKQKNNLKLCAIDLDGTLYKYPETQIAFINKKLGTKFKISDSLSPAITKMPIKQYLKLKDEYRETTGEVYGNPKPMKGALELLQGLKRKGYSIMILSARPYKKYPNIFENTLRWLKKNDLQFDCVFWDNNKNEKIIREFPKLKFIVEDNPEEAEKIAAFKIKCYLLNRPYNLKYTNSKVKRIDSLTDILEDV
mgnify:FL=1